MSVAPGGKPFERALPGTNELACRYAVLLDLYAELGTVSERVFQAIDAAAEPEIINDRLREKMAVADRIVLESRGIAALKKSLADSGGLCGEDRELIHELEDRLTRSVGLMVEQENRGRELVMRRGVKVIRR